MTEEKFQQICDSIIQGIESKEEYVQLCKDSWDFDNCKGLKKSEAQEIKNSFQLDFKLAGSEKMFYKDYHFGELQLRFMIPYGHGMMDCSYRVFKGMTDNSIPSFSYREIVKSVTSEFDNPEYTFPMNSNTEEFQKQLKTILNINEQILKVISFEIMNIKRSS